MFSKICFLLAILGLSISVHADPAPSPTPRLGSFIIPNQCAKACAIRNPSGECAAYNAEVCGAGYGCAPRCLNRDPAGNCTVYSPDFCGGGATCIPKCHYEISSGNAKKCVIFGADVCSLQIIGTR